MSNPEGDASVGFDAQETGGWATVSSTLTCPVGTAGRNRGHVPGTAQQMRVSHSQHCDSSQHRARKVAVGGPQARPCPHGVGLPSGGSVEVSALLSLLLLHTTQHEPGH